jgi:hypothetical protein
MTNFSTALLQEKEALVHRKLSEPKAGLETVARKNIPAPAKYRTMDV